MNIYLYFNSVMDIVNKQNKIYYMKLALHFGSWCALYFFINFILIVIELKPVHWSLILALCLVITAAIPTYLHFYILNKYFNRNHYFAYIILVFTIIGFSSLIAYYFFTSVYNSSMYYIAWCIDIVVVIIITSSLKILWNGLSERVKFQETRTKNLESELQLLKGQMNPHFYFNTLNNLYSLSLEKSDKVPGIIIQLSDIMRYILDSSKKDIVALDEEITYLKNYLALERLRFEAEDGIKFETQGDWKGKKIIPMILMPFAENCIKHGDVDCSKGWIIDINLSIKDNKLTFSTVNRIKNTRDIKGNLNSTKIGINNVQRRLELIYPNRHNLNINQHNTTFQVTLEIDL